MEAHNNSGGYMNNNSLCQRAIKCIPAEAQTYSKSYKYFTKSVVLDYGKGSKVWDVEGNKYTDYSCALGPVLVGKCDDRINAAIIKQLNKGISFSTVTRIEIELCEKLTQIIPGCEKVRLIKNGKDVTTAAVKLARAYTGRDIIVKCGYNGGDDWALAKEQGAKGIPQAVKDLTELFIYNDISSLETLFNKYPNKIAGVIFELVQGNGPKEGFLEAVKDLCHKNGSLFIADEVVTGARFALGGASEYYNIIPDIVCIGKAYGGECAISAVCGRRDIMSMIDSGQAFISTTFGGETLSIAAALATIEILEQPGTYEHIWSMGQRMLDGLQAAIDCWGLHECISTTGLSPHNGLAFKGIGSLDYLDLLSVYEERMLDSGIIVSDTGFIMLSHSAEDIRHFVDSAVKAMNDVRDAIQQDSTKGILTGRKINPVFKRR
jgi:glutamate-1-semialdehyde aminotransferase